MSNHSQYKNGFKGEVMDGAQLDKVMAGLEANNLVSYDCMLTGYVRSSSLLLSTVNILRKLKVH